MRFRQIVTQYTLDKLIDFADCLTESPMDYIDVKAPVVSVQYYLMRSR